MEQWDVSKQTVPVLSYAATKNIKHAAYVTEVLKMAFVGVACLVSCVCLMAAVCALFPCGSSGRS